MTEKEMHQRITAMPEELRKEVIQLIHEGYGETGIVNTTIATRKQVNALFQFVHGHKEKSYDL